MNENICDVVFFGFCCLFLFCVHNSAPYAVPTKFVIYISFNKEKKTHTRFTICIKSNFFSNQSKKLERKL